MGRKWKNKKSIHKVTNKKLVLDLEVDSFLIETKLGENPEGYYYVHEASAPPVNYFYIHYSETETEDEQTILIDEDTMKDLLYSYHPFLEDTEITRIETALGSDFFDEDI